MIDDGNVYIFEYKLIDAYFDSFLDDGHNHNFRDDANKDIFNEFGIKD